MRLFCVAALSFLCAACASHVAAPVHPLAADNARLKLELPLARKNELYSVFDLRHRQVQIKIRGESLKEIPILDMKVHRAWDAAAVSETVLKKGIADEPERTVIDPPKTPHNDYDTETVLKERVEDSLEMEDMPASFSIECDGGAKILILSRAREGPVRWVTRLANAGIRTLFFLKRLTSPRSPAATLVLSTDDARAVYWSVTPQQTSLIVPAA